MRADKAEANAAQLLARIHYERGDYQQAVNFSSAALRRSRDAREADDFILASRALTKLGEYDKARAAATTLGQIPGQKPASVAELAQVAHAEKGPQSAIDAIAESGLDLSDTSNAQPLRVLIDNLLELDQGSKALTTVDATLARNPDDAELHAIRGTVLIRLRRSDEAAQEFEAARKLDPEDATALAGLATLAGNARDFGKAIELFDLAAKAGGEGTGAYAYSAAQLTLQLGNEADAMERLGNIVRQHPGHAGSRNDLAWLLAESGGNLDTALSLAEDAQRLEPSPDILDTLGWVHIKRGEGAAAAAALEKALEQEPESASIRYHLGTALAMAGDSERAREMLESALDTEGFDEADAARRELAKLTP